MAAIGLAACGLMAPIIYCGTVLIGGQMRVDYSHKSRAISELVERDAPNKKLLDGMFAFYHIFHILGCSGIYLATNYMRGNWYSAAAMLVTSSVLGILMAIFPMDPISREASTPATRSGQIHIASAVVVSLFIVITLGLYANAGLTSTRFNSFGIFTATCVAIQVFTGLAAAVMAARLHPYMGLAERATIGNYLFWFFVTCCMVLSYYFPSS
jgi:hypothetical protein